ncbi:superoxide dismutase [Bhargavaea cecembensis]|uniref:Superoxide dismutase [Cu-Zn] n=1 Tax=Bhargavaea cecembensis TaxID=394098 RepID=A0A165GV24_9BACL|nr:superoxide dismutase family protein [Bhargavaea cecembensis]KZE37789.1 superoxide dismutase [Bhargavaea cecembensis]
MKKLWVGGMASGLLAAVLAGCGGQDQGTDNGETDTGTEDTENTETVQEDTGHNPAEDVLVQLQDVEGEPVAQAVLSEVDEGSVHVELAVENLPAGTHAFHVHEKGSCEAPDFESAGGHYNPGGTEHGKDSENGPHAGDFDNIEVGEDGTAKVEFDTDQISLQEDADNTLFTEEGTSLVIHAGADDYTSQPSGDAGERIACGVIQK